MAVTRTCDSCGEVIVDRAWRTHDDRYYEGSHYSVMRYTRMEARGTLTWSHTAHDLCGKCWGHIEKSLREAAEAPRAPKFNAGEGEVVQGEINVITADGSKHLVHGSYGFCSADGCREVFAALKKQVIGGEPMGYTTDWWEEAELVIDGVVEDSIHTKDRIEKGQQQPIDPCHPVGD